jgi:hypothetical protein
MNKQINYVSLAEYKVSVAVFNGLFRVQVDGLGADGQGSEYEIGIISNEIDDTVGWIILRDVWAKEEALEEAREAQDRIDNPEFYEDEVEVTTLSINTIFGDEVSDVPAV